MNAKNPGILAKTRQAEKSKHKLTVLTWFTIVLITSLSGCGGDGLNADPEVRDYSQFFTPLPVNTLYPESNEYNAAKEDLGEKLFWDPILSGNQNVACASCHHPDFAWADGRQLSIGSDGIGMGPNRFGSQVTELHSPTIMNVAFTGLNVPGEEEPDESGGYFWDLRAETLEAQAIEPIQNPVEMLGYNISVSEVENEMIMRLQAIPEYVTLFEDAFGEPDAISRNNIGKAIATFERRIFSPNTRFDQFLSGNTAVFNEQEVVGLNKFIDGGCADCHSGPLLSDNELQPDQIVINDLAVRTPSLRNIALTAPYMHDGSRTTLRDAIAEYEERGDLNVAIGDGDFGDIEVFLRTLTTTNFYSEIPESVPSGLPVGGDID